MQDHRGVLASLDHLVEVADRPLAHRPGQGSVLPHGLLALDEEPAEQVRGRQIVVAGHGVERTAEPGRHVAHEAALSASCGTLQQGGQTAAPGRQERLLFIVLRQIERKVSHVARARVHHAVPARTTHTERAGTCRQVISPAPGANISPIREARRWRCRQIRVRGRELVKFSRWTRARVPCSAPMPLSRRGAEAAEKSIPSTITTLPRASGGPAKPSVPRRPPVSYRRLQ